MTTLLGLVLAAGLTTAAFAPPSFAETAPAASGSGGSLDGVDDVLAPVTGRLTAVPSKVLASTSAGVGVRRGALPAGGSLAVTVTGRNGVPTTGVGSIRLAVTSTGSTRGGALTVYPEGSVRPSVPSLRFAQGSLVTTEVVVQVPASGRVVIHSSSTTHVRLDALGWGSAGPAVDAGTMQAVAPQTMAYTASGTRVRKGVLAAGRTVVVQAAGAPGVPAAGVGSVTVSVTSVGSTVAGALTVYADGAARPAMPSLRFARGVTTTSQVTVRVPASGRIVVHTTATTHVLLTTVAYSLDGLTSAAGTTTVEDPRLAVATSSGTGVAKAPVGAGKSVTVTIAGRAGVPTSGVGAVLLAVTSYSSTASGAVRVYPTGGSLPGTATLAFSRGVTTTGESLVVVPASGRLTVHSTATTHVRIDVVGHVLGADRSVVDAVPRATTLSPSPDQIVRVDGSGTGQQVVELTRTGRRPNVGDHVVAPASAHAPSGLLARIDDVQDTGSTWTVTTSPGRLSDAYSRFDVASRSVAVGTPVGASSRGAPTFSRASAATSVAGFECTGADGAVTPEISVSVEPGDITTDFTLEANVFAPYLNMSVGVSPTVTATASLSASVTCERELPIVARIPVSVGPPLEIAIRPVVVVSASGDISTTLTWRSRAFVGVLATKDGVDFSKGFGSSLDADIDGNASLSAQVAVRAVLAVAGTEELSDAGAAVPTVAVDATLGPEITLSYKGRAGCYEATAHARLALSASLDGLVKDWSFDALDTTTDDHVLWTTCKPWTGTVSITGQNAFVWSAEDSPYGQSGTFDTEYHWLVDPDDLAHPAATVNGRMSARSFSSAQGACQVSVHQTSGTVVADYVDAVTADGLQLSYPTARATATTDDGCDGVDSTGETDLGIDVGTSAFLVYLNHRLPAMLAASGGHTIDEIVTASIDQVCADAWYGCDFQSPHSEQKSGSWTAHIRITDRPDADSDGIPDVTP